MTAATRIIFDPKRQGDSPILPFDFISKLSAGETISTQVVTASVYTGVDANPSAIISGAATAATTIVSQKTTAGVIGVIYLLLCTITTSLGQTLVLEALLAVIPDGL